MDKVVHKSNPHDVYIGRPSRWGNPFVIGKDGTREEVIHKYQAWIFKQPEILKDLYTLKGKTLGCWCVPLACHGHYLAWLANLTKIGIVGSRTANDYSKLKNLMFSTFYRGHGLEDPLNHNYAIVSGGASGADTLGKCFAHDTKTTYIEFPADWDKHGRSAGFVRNEYIVNNSDIIIALWDGQSKGTQHTLNLAKAQKKPTFIIYF